MNKFKVGDKVKVRDYRGRWSKGIVFAVSEEWISVDFTPGGSYCIDPSEVFAAN